MYIDIFGLVVWCMTLEPSTKERGTTLKKFSSCEWTHSNEQSEPAVIYQMKSEVIVFTFCLYFDSLAKMQVVVFMVLATFEFEQPTEQHY